MIVKPIGLNLKKNDRVVEDGFLRECVNLQWRDGSFKPIPERLLTSIDASMYSDVIGHKVADEDRINLLGFYNGDGGNPFLAQNVAEWLGGAGAVYGTGLTWFGSIVNGVYYPLVNPVSIDVEKTPGMTHTIMNGLMYIMGNGDPDSRVYKKLQYNDAEQRYEVINMYDWKALNAYYPMQRSIIMEAPATPIAVYARCGYILSRYTLVLNTGEEVFHSPIYVNFIYGSRRLTEWPTSDVESVQVKNIHTFLNLNLEFENEDVLTKDISAINFYCSAPNYATTIDEKNIVSELSTPHLMFAKTMTDETLRGEVQKSAEQPFYLVKTIPKPVNEHVLLCTLSKFEKDVKFRYVDDMTSADPEKVVYSEVFLDTIAAGQPMPVDHFSAHELYGRMSTYNGVICVDTPMTVLSNGHIRQLSVKNDHCIQGAKVDTEDGNYFSGSPILDKSPSLPYLPTRTSTFRGILSYPDMRANYVGAGTDEPIYVACGTGPNTLMCSGQGAGWFGLGATIFTGGGEDAAHDGVGRWVAVGYGTNSLAHSADGKSWIGLGETIFTHGFSVAHGNGRWVAGGSGANSLAYSTDGASWVGIGTSIFTDCFGVFYADGKWVAVGSGPNSIAYSADGETWVGLGNSIFSSDGLAVHYGGSKWVAVGMGTNTIAHSNDGITWTGLGSSIFSEFGAGVAYGNGKWIAVGSGTNTLASSLDGVTWTGGGADKLTIYGADVVFGNGRFLISGASSTAPRIYASSDDGETWSETANDTFTSCLGLGFGTGMPLRLYKSRENKAHNLACVFDFLAIDVEAFGIVEYESKIMMYSPYSAAVSYAEPDVLTSGYVNKSYYRAENRVQFSQVGEFSLWPVSRSYRVGDGTIMRVGTNNVSPSMADVVSTLIVGTTDGIYSLNADSSGNNFIASITRIAKMPFISDQVLEIDDSFVFVSDKGLMVLMLGSEPKPLSYDYFGTDEGLVGNLILPNYTALTTYFGYQGNAQFHIDDHVNYFKGCKLAYDSARKTIWASNPQYSFSMLFDIKMASWSLSTTVFSEVIDLFSTVDGVYNWHLVRKVGTPNLAMLSGENNDTPVMFHMLTRPIKFGKDDVFKKIGRMFVRCELVRGDSGYFSCGVWGKQDIGKMKKEIAIAAIRETRSSFFPRQDIPISSALGKYKTITLLVGGIMLPESSIDGSEFDIRFVDDKKMR